MKKKTVEFINKIIAAICVLALIFIFMGVVMGASFNDFVVNPKCYSRGVFGMFKGSKIPNGYPKTAWQIEAEESEGVALQKAVMFQVNYDTPSDLSDVWINISDFYGDSLELELYQGSTSSSKLVKKTVLAKNSIKADEDGWFKLYDRNVDHLTSTVSSYFTLKVNAHVSLREIVFVRDTDKSGRALCSTTISTITIGENSQYRSSDTAEESIALFTEAKKLIDEQKTFKL